MKINAIDIRVGNLLEFEGKLWAVLKTMHTQPGKGGAYMQVEMKDIKGSTKTNVRFRSAEKVEKIQLEQKAFQYSYDGGDTIELMDKETFEQVSINKSILTEQQLPFLQEGMEITLEYYNESPLMAVLPDLATYEITECEPALKGQTAASSYKPAILENGVRIMVPPFINQGDKVVIKLETEEYMERAK